MLESQALRGWWDGVVTLKGRPSSSAEQCHTVYEQNSDQTDLCNNYAALSVRKTHATDKPHAQNNAEPAVQSHHPRLRCAEP